MKKELKTLNDLIELCDTCKVDYDFNCRHPCCRNHKKLKAEAIKWVKIFKYGTPSGHQFDIMDFADFFNLTEEDLK